MLFITNRRMLKRILHNQEAMMAGIDDLKQAVTDVVAEQGVLGTSIATANTNIETAIALIGTLKANGGLSDADAETLATTLQGSVTALKTAQGSLDAEATKLAGA